MELVRAARPATARPGGAGRARPGGGPRPGRAARGRSEHASTVLPIPTSSAISSRTGSSFSAISSGTSWYGRGSTRELGERAERAGAGAEAQADRVAEQPAGVEVARAGPGRAGRTRPARPAPAGGRSPVTSSSVPPSGRSRSRSSSELGQDDPLAPPGLDERADGEASSAASRRRAGSGRSSPSQSSRWPKRMTV